MPRIFRTTGLLLFGLALLSRSAQADIAITQNTNAMALANAVIASAGAGITITSAKFQGFQYDDPKFDVGASAGIYTLTGSPPHTYGLMTTGIVLTTGHVLDYQTGPNTAQDFSWAYDGGGVPATPAQEALLTPISDGFSNHFDVAQLDVTFNVQPGYSNIAFQVVFGTEEYPEFVGSPFIDAFGLYLNGSNIAFTANAPFGSGIAPVNVNHTNMMAIAGTELDGVLAPGGNPRVIFSAGVVPGSVSNVLTFIVGDTSDGFYDTTVYISLLTAIGDIDGDGLPDDWELLYFGSPTAADPNDDPDGDGLTNLQEFLAGTNPVNSASGLRITAIAREGNNLRITWNTAGVRTNRLQSTSGAAGGSYSNNFADITADVVIPIPGDAVTNQVDVGAATNNPAFYYRVRLVP